MSIYDFKVKSIDGDEVDLHEYEGKVLLIVNTASKCGFTPQYEELEEVYKKYNSKDFEILGFPSNQFAEQEPGSSSDIKSFCSINYGVTFPLFEKTEVRGDNVHPLFKLLTEKAPFKGFELDKESGKGLYGFISANLPDLIPGDSIKWNFTKFLIDKSGNVIGRYEPTVTPKEIIPDIEKLL